MPVGAGVPMGSDDWGQLLKNLDAGFSETLLQLIDRTGKKDSEIYKKANVDRKLFSKIRNNMDYKPSKTTALAFAFALELDIDETKDFIGRAGFALSHRGCKIKCVSLRRESSKLTHFVSFTECDKITGKD